MFCTPETAFNNSSFIVLRLSEASETWARGLRTVAYFWASNARGFEDGPFPWFPWPLRGASKLSAATRVETRAVCARALPLTRWSRTREEELFEFINFMLTYTTYPLQHTPEKAGHKHSLPSSGNGSQFARQCLARSRTLRLQLSAGAAVL